MTSASQTCRSERYTRGSRNWSTFCADSLRRSRIRETEADPESATSSASPCGPIESIDSVAALAEYIAALPDEFPLDFHKEEEALRKIGSGAATVLHFIGEGMSFSVRAVKRPEVPDAVLKRYPSMKLDQYELVAIKAGRIKTNEGHLDIAKAKAIRAIAWEIHVLTHPPVREAENIITLLGMAWESIDNGQGQDLLPAIALEYADQGSLDDLLDSQEYCLQFKLKKKLCLDVAQGLRVLHDNQIIHGDVKTGNVLLFTNCDGSLTAKISDFGCSMHTFGQEDTARLSGHSPPWDAPEYYMDNILLSDLPKVDIYSFGMLVWRVMLEGDTPLDFRRQAHLSPRHPFKFLAESDDKDENLNKIRVLKSDRGDIFLHMIIETIHEQGIDENMIRRLLESTIRADPHKRANDIKILILLLQGVDILDMPSDIPANAEYDRTYVDIVEVVLPSLELPLKPTAGITIPALAQRTMYLIDHLRKYQDFIYVDRRNQNRSFIPRPEVSHSIRQDYLRLATGTGSTSTSRARASFELALRLLFPAFDEPEVDHGLQWLGLAATEGIIEAQAIVYQLHSAFGKLCPKHYPLLDWLSSAAKEGSLVALGQLSRLDALKFQEAYDWRRSILRLNWGSRCPQKDYELLQKYDYLSKKGWESILGVPFREMPHQLPSFVDEMLSMGIIKDIHAPFLGKGHSLIHIFAAIGDAASVRALLALGADINQRALVSGQTPISCACFLENIGVVSYLLDAGADVRIPDVTGATVLHYATYLPELESHDIVEKLVSAGLDINQKSTVRKDTHLSFLGEDIIHCGTPLHWAVRLRRRHHIGLFLDFGADPSISDGTDELQHKLGDMKIIPSSGSRAGAGEFYSPLAIAVEDHQPEIVRQICKFLEKNGEQINLKAFMTMALSTPKAKMMCLNGPSYREDLVDTINLLSTDPLQEDRMGFAIVEGNETYVRHLLNEGFPPNKLIQGSSPLGMSLTKPFGQITLDLLEHGADPTLKSPRMDCSPLTLLAMRPAGGHTMKIINKMIAGGEPNQIGVELVYRRVVLDNDIEAANSLITRYPQVSSYSNRDLLKALVHRNSPDALVGLRHVLAHIREPELSDMMVDISCGETVYHALLSVGEDIRDDALNLRILSTLLAKYSAKDILDLPNKRGHTAMTMAIIAGNHYGVEGLLQAGADPQAGRNGTPILQALDRLLHPKSFSGGFNGISSRHRRAKRYEDNSVRIMMIFLKREAKLERVLDEVTREAIQQGLSTWRTDDFMEKGILAGLSQDSKADMVKVLRNSETEPPRLLRKNGSRRRLKIEELEAAMKVMWDIVVSDWSRTVQATSYN